MITRAALILLLSTASAQAADIKVVVPEIREKTPNGWTTKKPAVVTVSGHIEKGDNTKFSQTIGRIKNATVYLDSRGGNALASVRIGKTIRERNFHTAVLNFMDCLSGCALVWLGGTKRYLGGFAQVGFHGPFLNRNVASYGALDAAGRAAAIALTTNIVGNYLVKWLDLKKEAVGYVTMAPPEKLIYLTQEDGETYGIEFTRMNVPDYDPLP
jgi:hypothetical protein